MSETYDNLAIDAALERDAMHADLADLLNALGMGDYARPQSSHAVMQEAIAKVRAVYAEKVLRHQQLREVEARLDRVEALLDEADTDRARHTFPFVATDAVRAALRDPS